MKRFLLVLVVAISVLMEASAIDIALEMILDLPSGGPAGDFESSIMYLKNGDLLFKSKDALSLFKLKDDKWEALIDSYKDDSFNMMKKERSKKISNSLLTSNEENVYIYCINYKGVADEAYSISVDEDNRIVIKYIDREEFKRLTTYRDAIITPYPFYAEHVLQHGYVLKEVQGWHDPGFFNLILYNNKEEEIKNLLEKFRYSYTRSGWVAINETRDRVSALIEFTPEKGSEFYNPRYGGAMKLLIFKITY